MKQLYRRYIIVIMSKEERNIETMMTWTYSIKASMSKLRNCIE